MYGNENWHAVWGGLFMTWDLVFLPLLMVRSNLKYAHWLLQMLILLWLGGKSDQISAKINS